jgi:hypothetical protein
MDPVDDTTLSLMFSDWDPMHLYVGAVCLLPPSRYPVPSAFERLRLRMYLYNKMTWMPEIVERRDAIGRCGYELG